MLLVRPQRDHVQPPHELKLQAHKQISEDSSENHKAIVCECVDVYMDGWVDE